MLSVSIVTYHHRIADIRKVIECVLLESVDILYIIDNSSNDYLRDLEKLSDHIRYIHSKNLGYGAGHNIAIRDAIEKGADYHVVVNPDIYFEEGVLNQLITYMENDNTIGQVMPKVIYPDGRLQYLCKLIPTPLDLIFRRFLPTKWSTRHVEKFQLCFTNYDKPMNVPYLSGCFMFFRISALQKIGLFDERFFMYPEDIDITRRMHRCYKTMFYPLVTIVHDHAAASYKNYDMLKIHIKNMIKYFNKWGWILDSERKKINKQVLIELNFRK